MEIRHHLDDYRVIRITTSGQCYGLKSNTAHVPYARQFITIHTVRLGRKGNISLAFLFKTKTKTKHFRSKCCFLTDDNGFPVGLFSLFYKANGITAYSVSMHFRISCDGEIVETYFRRQAELNCEV